MIPFLKSIAKAYAARYPDLSEVCFLFPNKRSGTFFLKYLKEECGREVALAPEIKTITRFVEELSDRTVASRLDLIFLLYQCYREMRGLPLSVDDPESAADFDNFCGWGETVLSDFSEIDRYLADADAVFKNVKDYREISSNFLTEEQRRVMAEYFGRTDTGDPTGFWRNFDEDEDSLSEVKRRFLYLWRSMSPLYDSLKYKLGGMGLSTTGGAYRLAVERLREEGRPLLPFKKMVAVGFNALSASEMALFSEMRDFDGYEGYDAFCDFLWDATGPVLTKGDSTASRFIRINMKTFPSPEWAGPYVARSDSGSMPRIRIVSSPSQSAQAKIAGTLLSELKGRLPGEDISQAKVAVVLPDENLLLPMLYSLPEGMGNVNLTMGYSLRLTSVVPFVRHLRMLYRNRKPGGKPAFFQRDLRIFLAHPYSHAVLGTEAVNRLIGYMERHHRVVIPLDEIGRYSPEASSLLDFSGLRDGGDVLKFLDRILNRVREALPVADTSAMKSRLESDHIGLYRDALHRLGDLLQEYGMQTRPDTVFRLADKLLAGTTVGFEGEPLSGLQVMGTLETRSIDFEHIMILSMNERIMPLRSRRRSFIPDSLRHAYGMPPSNYSESIFSYYFYRMISRAKEVTLIHDARTGAGSGGVSRYILQLRYLFAKDKIEEQNWKFLLSGRSERDAGVGKSDWIKKRLALFEEASGSGKNLSASSLNTYLECQVRFFYQAVMGLDTDPAPTEFIDAIGVGNILHALMEHLYIPADKRGMYLDVPLMVTAEAIDGMLSDRDRLIRLTRRLINSMHYHHPEDRLDSPLPEASEIVGRQIVRQAVGVLGHDRELAPIRIYGCEIKERMRVRLPSGKTVNFKFAIDRLDEIETDGGPCLRIVDYKTGGVHLKVESLEELFDGGYRSKQIFQLFTYAWLWGKRTGTDNRRIRVEIYNVPKMMDNKEYLPEIGGEVADDYRPYSADFSTGVESLIDGIFENPRFEPAEDEGRCAMCNLRMLCGR